MSFFSARCWLCLLPLTLPHHGICHQCYASLPTRVPCCLRCGLPSEHPLHPCGRCLQHPPPWQHLISVSDYCPPLNLLIQRLKYQQEWSLATALARLLLLSYLDARRVRLLPKPDILTIVPLHRQRQWLRGFNQSDLLARPLAHWLGCSYIPSLITRQYNTPPQWGLSAQQRRHNLRKAFQCLHPVPQRHILLIDDVVTTGTTLKEICQPLQRQGSLSIQILCLCRTL